MALLGVVLSLTKGLPFLIVLFCVFIVTSLSLRCYTKLRHVPGPFLASLTNIPRVNWVLTNRAHDIHIALHRKYGNLVRFGPNMVSVGDPTEIPNIYGFTGKFVKVTKRQDISKF